MGETDERTELAGGRVLQPLIELMHTPPRDQATKSLQQFVSKSETFIVLQDLLECVALNRELIGWTETQPPHVDALDAWSAAPTSSARFWRWTRAPPRLECLHEQ